MAAVGDSTHKEDTIVRLKRLVGLNKWVNRRCLALWDQIRHPEQTSRTIAEVWADEQDHLMKMPPPFDGFIEDIRRPRS